MKDKMVIGILGGMGPAATSELFHRIIENTKAHSDQDHVSAIIVNDTQIPDRTEYILGRGKNPVPLLQSNLSKLKHAGADVALIPCMTAHTFIKKLNVSTPIKIVNAIEIVEDHINDFHPEVKNVGLLATTGSIQSKVFEEYLTKDIYIPNSWQQRQLMEAIYGSEGIKAGNVNSKQVLNIFKIIDDMYQKGIELLIAGCTELSLVIDEKILDVPVVDPITLLAKHAVRLGSSK